jgi:hypothetical protein
MHPVVADDLSGGGPLRKSGLSRARLCLATKSLICDQTEGLRVDGGMGDILFSKEDSFHPFF